MKDVDFEMDYLEFLKTIEALRFHVYQNKRILNYEELSEEQVVELIEHHARYKYRQETTNSVQSEPSLGFNEENIATPSNTATVAQMAKRTLTSIDSIFPAKPITAKQMKYFKLNFTNEMRSMDLDYLLSEDVIFPDTTNAKYEEFIKSNKFLYSALMKVTKDHEAREWLLSDDIIDDGHKGWLKLMKQYDTKDLEGSNLSDAMNNIVNLKLSKDHADAASSYVINFSAHLSDLVIEGKPMDQALSRELFLNSITHPSYFQVKTSLKLDGSSLDECMDKIMLISTAIEKEAEKSKRRIAKLKNDSENSRVTSHNNPPLKFMGKEVDEFGFLKDLDFSGTFQRKQE